MTKIWLLLLLAVALSVAGCATREEARGDQEFIPGRGWVPVNR